MIKVLVVDDIEQWCKFHSSVLTELYGDDVKIDEANSAFDGYQKVMENNKSPYDLIITDLQMESGYEPKEAGEWLVEQIKMLENYYKTQIIIISASPKIRYIAENYNVDFIPKAVARTTVLSYKEVLRL